MGPGCAPVFSNVADQITLGELIASGHLVRPRTFVIDLGKQHELQAVRQTASDFDMTAVAAILNTAADQPGGGAALAGKSRRTAKPSCSARRSPMPRRSARPFSKQGISAVLIHGELADSERKTRLREYEQGSAQVVVNVAVLTEGYDHPPTSCVVLLRPSSHASTFVQMVGRGLRVVDPEEFPGVIKEDCLILDFGTASLMHGTLEQSVNLDGREFPGEAPQKECPQCEGRVPLGTRNARCAAIVWDLVSTDNPVAAGRFRHDRDRSATAVIVPLVRPVRR